MLNITNHQGNADQNTMSYHITPVRMATLKKKKKITSVREDLGKLEPLFTIAPTMENSMAVPQKIKN